MTGETILVEYLRNVKKIHVYIEGEHDVVPKEVMKTLESLMIFDEKHAVVSNHGSTRIFAFSNAIPKVSIPAISFEPTYTSKDLSNVSAIACSNCNEPLTGEKKLIFKDLPSRYWMDLVDCWSCHKSEFAPITNKLEMASDGSNLLLPSPGTVHVGLDELVCHTDDINMGQCKHCLNEVGVATDDGSHVRLFKNSITLIEPTGRLPSMSTLHLLFAKLHEFKEAHASQRFHLHNGTETLSIEVINWDILYLSMKDGCFKPAVKVSVGQHDDHWEADPIHIDSKSLKALTESLSLSWPKLKVSASTISLVKLI